MKKRIFAMLLVAIVCCFMVVSVSADSVNADRTLPLVVDNAQLLTDNEETELIAKLQELTDTYQQEFAVVTITDLEEKTPMEYADDFYDYNGYGYGSNDDGLLLLYKDGEAGDRELYITTHGTTIDIFTDSDIDYVISAVQEKILNGDYTDAFDTFVYECEVILIDYNTVGVPFVMLLLCLLVGFVIAFIITAIQAASLKSVRKSKAAVNYVRQGSMILTNNQDIFLFRNVSRTKIESNNNSSTHTSSSGRTHGGSGSSF